MVSVFLPWLVDDTGSYLGIDQPDGRLTLAVGLVGLILAWYKVRIGWMAAGFVGAVLIRNLFLLNDLDSASAGFGLWLGAISFTIAAALQLTRLIQSVRSAVGDDS